MKPVFYLLAGPNGAGKSTLYKALLAGGQIPKDAEFVNADLYEAEHLQYIADARQRSEAARQWADKRRGELLAGSQSFVSETVFSHDSKLALIAQAQEKGFFVLLMVVCMDDPQRLVNRVSQRVSEGGHDVPADRILARYPRTLDNLEKAVRMSNAALMYDSESALPGAHRLVAACEGARTQVLHEPLPSWARRVLQAE